ncbi:protein SODIUM POTASSIUM ROOT DEFECTIVE 3-like [Trifolium pratense]|uniref:protein SODIUM POTASSIUM ROOT DEFECTIVE 3-like n=1 Tax=Trifolium pratense TaxID=57577 RepID=UPI001E6981E9|nr:protein SODIUM POTASSIUM ROOT DEFECTIVE 3-like [Trifolium pratense]
MKGIDMFCSSPASTAIIHSNMNQRSMLRRSRTTKTYDQRKNQLHHVPCSSQLPINPMPYFEKHRKSSSDKQNSSTTTDTRRKSSANVNDLSSRRYLLDDTPFIDWLSESNKILVPRGEAEVVSMDKKRKSDSHALVRSSSSALSSKDQVVVLRVSLHCKACEGKVRKHISKMEGVRSFNIEMETKKVTIIGAVTPLDVLASVSKVKSAQLWPSTTSSSSSSRLTFP